MREALEQLVCSLLYEGYALYPYTPGATKNATPTPFGIVYPPGYAEELPTTFDHLRLECVLEAEPEAELRATVRFLQASGERHQAGRAPARPRAGVGRRARRRRGGGDRSSSRARASSAGGCECAASGSTSGGCGASAPASTTRPRSKPGMERDGGVGGEPALDPRRGRDLAPAALSSPLEREGPAGEAVEASKSVNTFPVLASPGDDAILAATIVLPDHPRMAPESLGNLFDNTEIEEALLLHVKALSEGEREAIAAQDPAVREMVERAERTTPEQMLTLHGRLEDTGAPTVPQWTEPGAPADPGPPAGAGAPEPRRARCSSSTASPSARGRR